MNPTRPNYEAELEAILAAIEIVLPSSVILAGKVVPLMDSLRGDAPFSSEGFPMVPMIQSALYYNCYCRRLGQEPASPGAVVSAAESSKLIGSLSEANAGSSRWDHNWLVRRVESTGQIWAEKNGVVRILPPGEYIDMTGPGATVRTGSSVTIYVTRESTTVQPGLYFAFGETVMPSDPYDMVRIYWNVSVEAVPKLLMRVSGDLNRFQVPFQFKCPIHPQGYDRRDAAVLYIQKKFYAIVRQLVIRWSSECGAALRDDIPLFTLPIARGIALAEDPGNGESFGMNRCRHLAESVWDAFSRGTPRSEWLPEIKQHFRKNGIDLGRPYLNVGSPDCYSLHIHAGGTP